MPGALAAGFRPLLTGLLLAAGLVVFSAATAHATSAEGDLRLVNNNGTDTTSSGEGLVQIYHNNKWDGVCDDYWELRSANVACRQLGYSGAEEAN